MKTMKERTFDTNYDEAFDDFDSRHYTFADSRNICHTSETSKKKNEKEHGLVQSKYYGMCTVFYTYDSI